MSSDLLLELVGAQGLLVWATGDKLNYRSGKKAALQPELRARLVADKANLLALIGPHRYAPLSFAQQRLWFLDQLTPGLPTYNIPLGLRLTGVLEIAALSQSLNHLVQRHETLRTTFRLIGTQAIQVIAPPAAVPLPLLDLSTLAAAEREAQLQAHLQAELRQTFSLTEGPLLRASLLRLAETEHLLCVVMHHSISDGWSMGVFLHELSTLYAACATHQPDPLSELPLQYVDYALWQRQWLAGPVLEEQVAYWKNALANVPATLELATDHPRPAVQTFAGATYEFRLSPTLTAAVRALAQSAGVTLFMLLLAAFQTLLHRYTGQTDFVVGTPIANRPRAELETLIGFFVNTLALRAQFTEALTFTDLLRQVRETCLGAYAHQDLPFEKLVEELRLPRDLSRNALFQVLFAVENTPAPLPTLPHLTAHPTILHGHTAKFDLTLTWREAPTELTGVLEYSTDLFTAETITRLAGHLQTLLAGIVAQPTQRIATLPLLTAPEHQQLVETWNATAHPYAQDRCLHELFAEQAARTPEAIAVREWGNAPLTYRDLDTRANQLAQYLRTLGVGPETLVGVSLERTPQVIVALLAIFKAGAAYVPLDPAYPADRLAFMLADAQPKALLTSTAIAPRLPATSAKVVCLDTLVLPAMPTPLPAIRATSDNLAYVLFTSGSTGRPKGVAIAHRSAVAMLAWAHATYAPEHLQQVLFATSLNFDLSVFELFVPLTCGGSVVIAENALQLLTEQPPGLTLINTVPSAMQELLRAQRVPPSVQVVNLAGEPLKASLVQSLYALPHIQQVYNLYGPTEDTTYSTFALCERNGAAPPIGRPLHNSQAYVLDAHLNPVPIGVPGEVYLGGAGLARGYLQRPALTAERFVPDPFSPEPSARLYKTGDLARWRADGQLDFLGRRDHQIKLRGYRIELGEIEAALLTHPALREAVVLAREDTPGDKRLVAYLVGAASAAPTIREHLKARLPEYMVPTAFVWLAALPLTPNGKLNRSALPAPDWSDPHTAEFVAPRTPTERALAAIWQDVLRLDDISVYAHFFELGGHSLLATQVVARIRQTLQRELPLATLFQTPVLAELAQVLDNASASEPQPTPALALRPRAETEPLWLSFAQQRLWFLEQLNPGTATYNLPLGLRLSGAVDITVLTHSLSAIVQRHAALRTTFRAEGDQAVQVIAPPAPVPLPVLDVSALPAAERAAQAQHHFHTEAQRPFSLTAGPLLRASLVHLSQTEHLLCLIMHHSISDGWSLGIFQQELATLYTAFAAGQTSPLPELAIQYADFAAWQRQWLSGAVLEKHLNYWKNALANVPLTLELPTDYPRPAVQAFAGALHEFEIAPALTAALRTLAQNEHATLFMVLLAAFKVLLYRYTGQSDFAVGSPIANRPHAALEPIIGFFVNTLALRTQLADALPFTTLLHQVRETCLGAYAHQDLPFEKLIEALRVPRDPARAPLFQTMFDLQEAAPTLAASANALGITPQAVTLPIAKFDLSLNIQVNADHLSASFEYRTDLFEATTIARMAGHFITLLTSLTAAPSCKIAQLNLLTAAEREQLLQWSAPPEQRGRLSLSKPESLRHPERLSQAELVEGSPERLRHPEPVEGSPEPATCVHHLFETQAAQTPSAIAVVAFLDAAMDTATDLRFQVTYAELNARANQLAHYLQQLGVGPEVCVGLCFRRSIDLMVSVLAVLKAGGAYVPLDPKLPPERLATVQADAGLHHILTTHKLAGHLPAAVEHLICLDDPTPAWAQCSAANPTSPVEARNLVYVIYTSGSTGKPKGVMLAHGNLVNAYRGWETAYALGPRDKHLQMANFSFDVFCGDFARALCSGGTLVMCPYEFLLAPPRLATLLRQEAITVAEFVPAVFRGLADHLAALRQGLAFMRILIVASDSWYGEEYEKYRRFCGPTTQLINSYGLTEATIDSTFFSATVNGRTQPLAPKRLVPIGRPFRNNQIYILDPYLEPVPVGIPGEIYVGGAGLARGYLHQPTLTVERFIPDPFASGAGQGARLYRTGDKAYYLPDGNVALLGRLDHQVKIRGHRIETGEIETALAQHPAVNTCVVVPQPDQWGQPCLVAYVVPQIAPPTSADLRLFLKAKLPDYMVPAAFLFLPALPLNASGKINRRALPSPDWAQLQSAEPSVVAPPRTPIEQTLTAIWQNVLGHEKVGIYDNFFEIGGHSLLLLRMHQQLSQQLQREIALMDLFTYPTIETLAAYLSQAASLVAPPTLTEAQARAEKQKDARRQRQQQREATRK